MRSIQDHRDSEVLYFEDKLLPALSAFGTSLHKQRVSSMACTKPLLQLFIIKIHFRMRFDPPQTRSLTVKEVMEVVPGGPLLLLLGHRAPPLEVPALGAVKVPNGWKSRARRSGHCSRWLNDMNCDEIWCCE